MFRILIGIVLPDIIHEFELNEVEAGVVSASALIAATVAMIVGGCLSSVVGKKPMLILGSSLFAFGILLTGLSRNYFMIIGLLSFAGFGGGFLVLALYAFVGELFKTSRGLSVGIVNTVYGVGGFLGAWIAGNMAGIYGWTSPFMLFGTVAFVSCIGQWLTFRSPHLTEHAMVKSQVGEVPSFKRLFSNRRLIPILASMFIVNFGFIANFTWTPTFLIRIDGLSSPQAGLVVGLMSIVGALGATVFGGLSDRFGRRIVAAASGVVCGSIGLIFYGGVYAFEVLTMLSIFYGFAMYAYWNLLISFAQDLVNTEEIGAVTGLIQTLAMIGGMLAPIAAGILIASFKMAEAMILSVCLPYFLYGSLILLKTR